MSKIFERFKIFAQFKLFYYYAWDGISSTCQSGFGYWYYWGGIRCWTSRRLYRFEYHCKIVNKWYSSKSLYECWCCKFKIFPIQILKILYLRMFSQIHEIFPQKYPNFKSLFFVTFSCLHNFSPDFFFITQNFEHLFLHHYIYFSSLVLAWLE